MTISTVSFDKAKIFKNKMFFAEYHNNGVSLNVFDNFGNNIVNRLAYKPVRTVDGDRVIIMKKNQYEIPEQGTFFQIVQRIYDKTGKFLDSKKEFFKA